MSPAPIPTETELEQSPAGLLGLRAFHWLPAWARGYLPGVLGLLLLTIPMYFVYATPPPRNALVGALLTIGLLVLILGSAWLGYGPGIVVCGLTCFALPLVLPHANRGFQTNLIQFAVLACISLLVSRVADTGRKHRAALQRSAVDLEAIVQARTAELTQTAKALHEQAQLVELSHDAILAVDLAGIIGFWSAGAERMYGWQKQEALGKCSHELLLTSFPESLEYIKQAVVTQGRWQGELQHQRRDGVKLRVLSRWVLRPADGADPPGILEINTDITEQRQIEEQLRNTQRLESLGVLAGGIAHDFNNLLTGIMGQSSLALDGMTPADPKYALLQGVLHAAERAADLTRQLLAYAGKGRYVVQPLDLSTQVREISELLMASIPKTVRLKLELANELPAVEADPGQVQQVIMNLIINGAEAIDSAGGTIRVTTTTQELDDYAIRMLAVPDMHLRPGLYVSLEVQDNGTGMSEPTMARMFEPFFTTKFTGRGLGLSAVLGIVQGHGGALKVYSTLGQGTTVKVLLPAGTTKARTRTARAAGDLAGKGRVLIVDDEDIVRHTAAKTLQHHGYTTIMAANGVEAVELFRRDPTGFAAVLLDLTMPVMGGEETLRQLLVLNPHVRVLLLSGYNESEALQRFTGKDLAGFLKKPYTASDLAEKVKDVTSEFS